MTRPFIIDTDTASDDAVALIMALQAPKMGIDIDVKAITVVNGNMPVDRMCQFIAAPIVRWCARMYLRTGFMDKTAYRIAASRRARARPPPPVMRSKL